MNKQLILEKYYKELADHLIDVFGRMCDELRSSEVNDLFGSFADAEEEDTEDEVAEGDEDDTDGVVVVSVHIDGDVDEGDIGKILKRAVRQALIRQ